MVRGLRAILRDVIAGVGDVAPGGVVPEYLALPARVVDLAAGRDLNTGALGCAPGVPLLTNTLSSLAVVILRADRWHVIAAVGRRTPAGSGHEARANAAVVVGEAALRDRDTGLALRTPRVALLANAFAGLTVVARGLRALFWYVITLVGNLAPGRLVDEC